VFLERKNVEKHHKRFLTFSREKSLNNCFKNGLKQKTEFIATDKKYRSYAKEPLDY